MKRSERQEHVVKWLQRLQAEICSTLEKEEATARFAHDPWQREHNAGGGNTRTLENGTVLEKAGVAFSAITGHQLPPSVLSRHPEASGGFFVTGLSLVLHPSNPHAPTVHLNYRYFETQDETVWWFGGGADLTPHYLYAEDTQHFHATHQAACDTHHPDLYAGLSGWCDRYFHNKHRQERRGVGGIFFDDFSSAGIQSPELTLPWAQDWDGVFAVVQTLGAAFLPAYLPILQRRKSTAFSDPERQWQLLRRGRYVEFNLVHDRGTLFGLQTAGRIESILMSLPPLCAWRYNHTPAPGSREAELLECLRQV